MSNKRSSVKKLMCVLCTSLQSIVGTGLARDKKVNYQGTKFRFLRDVGEVPVKQKKEKGFVGEAIETVTNHPVLSAASVLIGGDILVKGGELAWKRGIQPWYLSTFDCSKYYGYLYNCFNLAYGRISKIFAVCQKNDSLSSGIGRVLDKLCGENGVYNSKTGIRNLNNGQKLKEIELEDVNQLDGALFLLSEIFSTGKMENNEYYYDVIQNLKKIFPGCSVHDSYKKIGKVENLHPEKISSRLVEADGRFGWFSRFAAGYGKLKQKLPFNPFPLIYLIRKYIVTKCLPADLGNFTNLVSCGVVRISDTNPFVKNYGNDGRVHNGDDVAIENYLSLSRTGDRLTIAFWLANRNMSNLQNGDEAKKVECTYTIPTVPDDKSKSVLSFGERWDKPKFVGDRLLYNGVIHKFA